MGKELYPAFAQIRFVPLPMFVMYVFNDNIFAITKTINSVFLICVVYICLNYQIVFYPLAFFFHLRAGLSFYVRCSPSFLIVVLKRLALI